MYTCYGRIVMITVLLYHFDFCTLYTTIMLFNSPFIIFYSSHMAA